MEKASNGLTKEGRKLLLTAAGNLLQRNLIGLEEYGLFFLFLLQYQGVAVQWKDLYEVTGRSKHSLPPMVDKLEAAGLLRKERLQGAIRVFMTPENCTAGFRVFRTSISSSIYNTYKEDIDRIIEHLNKVSGKHFRNTNGDTQSKIVALLRRGYTYDDFVRVHRNKKDWIGDPVMDRYFRPVTLYCPSKFEAYLNERKILDTKKATTSLHRTPKKKQEMQEALKAFEEKYKDVQV